MGLKVFFGWEDSVNTFRTAVCVVKWLSWFFKDHCVVIFQKIGCLAL